VNNKYIEIAKEIVLRNINLDEINVFLFGSRASGDDKLQSDLDIGFLGKKEIDWRTLRKISNELEDSKIPFHFDLIDFSKVNERFKKIALQNIVLWNKAKNSNIN
jgi:predicted nucleotidyltransferase